MVDGWGFGDDDDDDDDDVDTDGGSGSVAAVPCRVYYGYSHSHIHTMSYMPFLCFPSSLSLSLSSLFPLPLLSFYPFTIVRTRCSG